MMRTYTPDLNTLPPPTPEWIVEAVNKYTLLHAHGYDYEPFLKMPRREAERAMAASRDYIRYHCTEEVIAALEIFKWFPPNVDDSHVFIAARYICMVYAALAAERKLKVRTICQGSLALAAEYAGVYWRVRESDGWVMLGVSRAKYKEQEKRLFNLGKIPMRNPESVKAMKAKRNARRVNP